MVTPSRNGNADFAIDSRLTLGLTLSSMSNLTSAKYVKFTIKFDNNNNKNYWSI